MKLISLSNKNTAVILSYIIVFTGACSLIIGLINLIHYGYDCQIEGASWLQKGESPYAVFLNNQHSFRFSRSPTHLPQSYYLLLPFAMLGDYLGYLFYGLVGVALHCSNKWLKRGNSNFLILVFALFATTPFRNNLGNGQYLFFFFGLVIIFDHLATEAKSRFLIFGMAPLILLLLAAKPTSFFWLLIYYPVNKKFLTIYSLTFLWQAIVIVVFAIITHGSIAIFISDYLKILALHGNLTASINSIFSVSFSTWLRTAISLLVLVNLAVFGALIVSRFNKRILVERRTWLFSCIVLSFILVYHNNYDSILLLLPLFISNENAFTWKNKWLLGLLIYMIAGKLIFMIGVNDTTVGLNNLIIVVFATLAQLDFVRQTRTTNQKRLLILAES